MTSYLDSPSRVYGALDKRSLVKVTFDAQPYYTYNLQKGRKEEVMTEDMPQGGWINNKNFPIIQRWNCTPAGPGVDRANAEAVTGVDRVYPKREVSLGYGRLETCF